MRTLYVVVCTYRLRNGSIRKDIEQPIAETRREKAEERLKKSLAKPHYISGWIKELTVQW